MIPREAIADFALKCRKLFKVVVYWIQSLCTFMLKYEVDTTLSFIHSFIHSFIPPNYHNLPNDPRTQRYISPTSTQIWILVAAGFELLTGDQKRRYERLSFEAFWASEIAICGMMGKWKGLFGMAANAINRYLPGHRMQTCQAVLLLCCSVTDKCNKQNVLNVVDDFWFVFCNVGNKTFEHCS